MNIVAIGLNHKSAPVEVRERVALLEEELPAALAYLRRYVEEGAILSTCNRTEVYATASDAQSGLEALKAFLVDYGRSSAEEIGPYLYTHRHEEAARHLFAVASGIDSMILGETEILGQVRDALAEASKAETISIPLSRLFHWALRTGRKAREETAVSRHAVSVSYAGVQMARQVFGGLEQCRVLVISAGEAGKLTAKSLRDSGARQVAVANRTYSRAAALAAELGGHPVDFERIGEALVEYDIVISATASARYLLPKETVAQAMARRDGRPLCLIDIAVPRDIDPDSRLIENVFLYDIDDLEAVSLAGMEERKKAVTQVRGIIDGEVERFMQWLRSLEAVPVVKSLRHKGESIRRRETEKSLAKLRHLSPEDRERVEALGKAIAKKLLHDPIVSLKAQGQSKGYIDAARELFRLEEE